MREGGREGGMDGTSVTVKCDNRCGHLQKARAPIF